MIQLGNEVRDRVTGFTGIAVCRAEHLFGCIRIGVKPQGFDKDGKLQEQEFFDEPALEVVSDGIVPSLPKPAEPETKPPGGPDRERPHNERY
jgi:hypothetical protein